MALIKCPDCNKDVSDSASECQNCGHKFSNPKSTGCSTGIITGLIVTILIILLLAYMFSGDKSPGLIQDENTYSTEWREPYSSEIRDIGKIMVNNNIGGCGEFWVKETSSSEYVVACTADGENWTYYVVWTKTEKIYLANDEMLLRLKPPR